MHNWKLAVVIAAISAGQICMAGYTENKPQNNNVSFIFSIDGFDGSMTVVL